MAKETFKCIKDVFAAGTWNGDHYTEADLDEMVKNFDSLKATDVRFKDGIPLKVDFFKDTKPEGHGGMPAAGWITHLYKEGAKLYAEIERIPRTIKDLIESKAYRQVSAEIAWTKATGKVMRAVALLGVEYPGVHNLEEFAALYTAITEPDEVLKTYITEDNSHMEKELQEAKVKLEKAEADVKLYKESSEKTEAEKKVAVDAAAEATRKYNELLARQRTEGIKLFIEAEKKEGRILPAHEQAILSVMESLDDTKTVKFTEGDKEVEKSIGDVFKAYISSLPKLVNFQEQSTVGKELVSEFVAKPEDEAGMKDRQELDWKAKQYMEKAKKEGKEVLYKDALVAVAKEQKQEQK